MIKTKVTLEEHDKGWKTFRKRMKEINGTYVSVGVHEDAGEYEDGKGVTAVDTAFWNEFGTENIPQRSFIRSTIIERASDLNSLREQWLNKITQGQATPKTALTAMGFLMQQWIMNKIRSNVPPANAESTQEAKQRDGVPQITLMHTQLLLRSIAFKVKGV